MSQLLSVEFDLTLEQKSQLDPLFALASKDFTEAEPGAVFMQVLMDIKDGRAYARARYYPNHRAVKIKEQLR
jgi:hypothetical protein